MNGVSAPQLAHCIAMCHQKNVPIQITGSVASVFELIGVVVIVAIAKRLLLFQGLLHQK